MRESFDHLLSAMADRYVVERELGGGMADGERFLIVKLPERRPQPRVVVVVNWFDGLRAKVPR
jgi:hypothetical protein